MEYLLLEKVLYKYSSGKIISIVVKHNVNRQSQYNKSYRTKSGRKVL